MRITEMEGNVFGMSNGSKSTDPKEYSRATLLRVIKNGARSRRRGMSEVIEDAPCQYCGEPFDYAGRCYCHDEDEEDWEEE